MKYLFAFEKLRVWQQSRNLVKEIYTLTSTFPKEEMFGLISQLRRATISISSNLAEGSSRMTKKDQARFTTMAYSSLMEVTNQLTIAMDLGFLSKNEYLNIKPKLGMLSSQINKLRLSQLA